MLYGRNNFTPGHGISLPGRPVVVDSISSSAVNPWKSISCRMAVGCWLEDVDVEMGMGMDRWPPLTPLFSAQIAADGTHSTFNLKPHSVLALSVFQLGRLQVSHPAFEPHLFIYSCELPWDICMYVLHTWCLHTVAHICSVLFCGSLSVCTRTVAGFSIWFISFQFCFLCIVRMRQGNLEPRSKLNSPSNFGTV